jgi:hypothetical protein
LAQADREKLLWREKTETDYTNDLEIRVFGMRRSGNHGVINWLGFHAPVPPHFFDCASNRGHSPFVTGKGRTDDHPSLRGLWYPHPNYKAASVEDLMVVRFMSKEILLYSYEDFDLQKMTSEEFPHNREMAVGRSRKKVDIVILRDFPNWIASFIMQKDSRLDSEANSWQNMTHPRFEKNREELPYFNYYDGWEEDAFYRKSQNAPPLVGGDE